MSIKRYKLSDDPIQGDIISSNIYKRREKIYWNIKNFAHQSSNDGILAENILRLSFDGVNLNHLSKNHPHVDIAILNKIDDFADENEIISVKSTIRKNPTLRNLISDTKSIKLESMISYLIFALDNFELKYEKRFFKPRNLLLNAIKTIKNKKNKDYIAVINTTIFYLVQKNRKEEESNFLKDINIIGECDDKEVINNKKYTLTYGSYTSYRIGVLRKLSYLDAPISLGAVYLKETKDGLTCFIYKTNSIKLNRYWEKLVRIWEELEYFDYDSVKYLRYDQVRELFNIKDEFPIQIQISIGDYLPNSSLDYSDKSERERVEISKQRSSKRTKKLYVATKFKDADFGENDDDVNKFFLNSIDILENDPKVITKFNRFISTIKNPPKLTKWW